MGIVLIGGYIVRKIGRDFRAIREQLTMKRQEKEWILSQRACRELKDEDGLTLLHEAVKEGRTEITRLLLDQGANREAINTNNQTPLDLATDKGYEEVARLLRTVEANR